MLKTNQDKLPVVSVQGQVWHPKFRAEGNMTPDGQILWVQGVGGITYNAKIGDSCMGWVADHLEPGVSTRHPEERQNNAYACFSCIGNTAEVKSGDAKGARGIVTGKHGGCDHLMVHFPQEVLEKLSIDDKIGVRASGQGLKLLDHPGVVLRNMGPQLLEKMTLSEQDGKLRVGVAKLVPACLMGSGLGMGNAASGDYDITVFDQELAAEYGLNELRFGDIVGILDADTRYGRTYRGGAVTIGVIIHGDSDVSGHGPGVTTLMSCKAREIEPVVTEGANLADYFLNQDGTLKAE